MEPSRVGVTTAGILLCNFTLHDSDPNAATGASDFLSLKSPIYHFAASKIFPRVEMIPRGPVESWETLNSLKSNSSWWLYLLWLHTFAQRDSGLWLSKSTNHCLCRLGNSGKYSETHLGQWVEEDGWRCRLTNIIRRHEGVLNVEGYCTAIVPLHSPPACFQ